MITAVEKRKRIIRSNILISFFFLLLLAGVGSTIFYYDRANYNLARAKKAEDTLLQRNHELEDLKRECNKKNEILNNTLDKTIDSVLESQQPKKIVKSLGKRRDSARVWARIGYDRLKKYDFAGAKDAFLKSENWYPGYRDSYDVYMLLRQESDNFASPQVQKQLLEKIYRDYNLLGRLSKDDIKSY